MIFTHYVANNKLSLYIFHIMFSSFIHSFIQICRQFSLRKNPKVINNRLLNNNPLCAYRRCYARDSSRQPGRHTKPNRSANDYSPPSVAHRIPSQTYAYAEQQSEESQTVSTEDTYSWYVNVRRRQSQDSRKNENIHNENRVNEDNNNNNNNENDNKETHIIQILKQVLTILL